MALEMPYEVLVMHFQSSYSAARAALSADGVLGGAGAARVEVGVGVDQRRQRLWRGRCRAATAHRNTISVTQ